jgi:parallel beta-helix repeat protein
MKKVSLLLKLFVSMSLVVLFTVTAYAATLEVGEGKPYTSIQAAINAAVTGDTVLVYDGTYVENISFMGKAITVKSVNGAASTIIDGNASGSVVTFNNGEGSGSVFDGFTITNGNTAANGGGIYCYSSSSPTISNCTITGNTAGYGGGIYIHYSSPTITNCTVAGNTANYSGGGIVCFSYSSLSISNCTITGNMANSEGGGIYINAYSSPTIANCTITGNTANFGGGIFCRGESTPTITNCTIAGNTANYEGGGIRFRDSSSPTINNCTITGNMANYGGGIVCSYYSFPTITNCTITGNTANYEGGGIWCVSSSPTVKNSILWGDSAATGNEIYLGSAATITVTYSDVDQDGYAGSNGNIRQDPLFIDPINGDFHLQPDSPCIDAGTSDDAPSTDMEGFPRYDDPLVPNTGGGTYPYYDMGAYENQVGQVVRVTSPEGGDVLTSGSTHLIEWVTNATENPVASVRLFYSENAGMSWRPIGRTIMGNPGGFPWRVARVFETKTDCKVKVVLRDAGGMILGSDESAGSFTIQPGPDLRRIH